MEDELQKYEKAKKNARWKGATASYASKHQFLARNFGNPASCEKCKITGTYEKGGRWNIQWAKKQYAEYSHSKADYLGLCRSCHRKYDMTEKELARLRHMASNQTIEQLAKLSVKRSVIAKARARNEYGRYTSKTA